MACALHPKYRVLRRPSCECQDCWKLWNLKRFGEALDSIAAARPRVAEMATAIRMAAEELDGSDLGRLCDKAENILLRVKVTDANVKGTVKFISDNYAECFKRL
ncbi:hypothetical protein AYO40_03445 [Planctomycetaceae bacterium SCGC AG-212-D15]|nr:hypothetical protein AYO40_03445 [Planctomycetaceae bacterium SCGC AG-212-D15]